MAPLGEGRARTLTARLLLWTSAAVLVVLVAFGFVLDRVLERYFVDQVTESLVAEARTVQQALVPDADEALQPDVIRLGGALAARITVIRTDGVVLADSQHDPATMENHRDRPEVRQAIGGHIGVASRPSATIGIPFRYVALPPADGRLVRVALPLTTVQQKLRSVRVILVAGFSIAGLAGLIALAGVARGISRPLRRITESVETPADETRPAPVPETGTKELVVLARTLNRMRAEVGRRMADTREERETRDAILAALDEGIVLFTEEGETRYQNESATRLLGGPIDHVRQVVPAPLQHLVAAANGTEADEVEVAVEAPPRTLRASAVRIPPGGSVLLVVRDVTEARGLDAIRRDFVANASHELKTPAASIQALAETLVSAAADDPAATRRFAEGLSREALRLARIVSDLLDLSRLEGGPLDGDAVRLDAVALEEVERSRALAFEGRLTLSIEDEPVEVRGSARDLALMVRNLIENAIQYTRPGGGVEIRVGPRDGGAELVVRDTGIGIPARDRDRIFERFYRVDRARSRETGGTGLGLSIVRHVAENHGGSVSVDSELGAGSTFTVRLPAVGAGDAGPAGAS